METNNLKIVCFIDNYTNGSKLETAFIDHSINNSSLNTNYFSKICSTCPYLLLTKDNAPSLQSSISQNDKWEVMLILDTKVDNGLLSNNLIFTPETLVMYHTKPNPSIVTVPLTTKVKKLKKGQHSYHHGSYSILGEFTKAYDENINTWNATKFDEAKQKLIKWFNLNEKLNIALEFLHNSLGGKPADNSILTKGEEKFDLNAKLKKDNIEKTLENWIKELDGKKGGAYNIALANVRDALLEQAGLTGEN